MLDEILEKEITLIHKNAEADINSVNYFVGLVERFEKRFKGYSQFEIYKEIKEAVKELHEIYSFGDENGFVSFRKDENIERSVVLGFEEVHGSDEGILDGYYDPGKSLNLTSRGKEILNGYRLARRELSLEENRKHILKKCLSLSEHLDW